MAPAAAGSAIVTIDDVRRQWARVLEDIKRTKMICHALLIDGTPLEVSGDTLTVGLRSVYAFHMENLNRPENRDIVEGALARVLSKPLRFRCRLYDVPQADPGGNVAPGAGRGGRSSRRPGGRGGPARTPSWPDRRRVPVGRMRCA